LHGAGTIRELPVWEAMVLKRMVVLAALLVAVSQSAALAQERGPLVMRAEFEWTALGVVAGVAVGALVWLTDPANPGNNLGDSIAVGAAWGSILGAGFGLYVLQRSAIFPTAAAQNPLDPRNRISADPVADLNGQPYLLAHRDAAQPVGPGLRVPVFSLHF
jgi:hypothetical protein